MFKKIKEYFTHNEKKIRDNRWIFASMLVGSALSLIASFVLSVEAVELAANPNAVLSCSVNSFCSSLTKLVFSEQEQELKFTYSPDHYSHAPQEIIVRGNAVSRKPAMTAGIIPNTSIWLCQAAAVMPAGERPASQGATPATAASAARTKKMRKGRCVHAEQSPPAVTRHRLAIR